MSVSGALKMVVSSASNKILFVYGDKSFLVQIFKVFIKNTKKDLVFPTNYYVILLYPTWHF